MFINRKCAGWWFQRFNPSKKYESQLEVSCLNLLDICTHGHLFTITCHKGDYTFYPRYSMYGISTYIWVMFGVNVCRYNIPYIHLGMKMRFSWCTSNCELFRAMSVEPSQVCCAPRLQGHAHGFVPSLW